MALPGSDRPPQDSDIVFRGDPEYLPLNGFTPPVGSGG
jgi:hypothetical protein